MSKTWLRADGVKAICSIPMLVISFGTFCTLAMHSYKNQTLIYWPLFIAAAIMVVVYILTLVLVCHDRDGH